MNLREALRLERIPYREGARENEVLVCCPFCIHRGHSRDTKFRLGVNIGSGLAHCFQCGWKARNFYQILRKRGVNVSDLVAAPIEKKIATEVELPEGFEELAPLLRKRRLKNCSRMVQNAAWYALARGITKEQIARHHIGFTVTGRYAGRIIFPVFKRQTLVSFVARDFTGESDRRYLNSPGPKWVWNGDAIRRGQPVCVFEGIVKALAGERALSGIICVATLGRSATPEQLDRIGKAAEVVWFPDPDPPGVEGFINSASELDRAKFAWPPPCLQADDMTPHDIQTRWRDAQVFNSSLGVVAMRLAKMRRSKEYQRCAAAM